MSIKKLLPNQLKVCQTLVCCPVCKNNLQFEKTNGEKATFCKSCQKYYPIYDGILHLCPPLDKDLQASIQKWDEFYKQFQDKKQYYKEYSQYQELYFEDTYSQLKQAHGLKGSVYLEIGCGRFYFGQDIADECAFVVGIDLSIHSLLIAKKMLDEKNVKNYLLIFGDILRLPIKSQKIDIIYGGGVIEHFKNTQQCVNELYRVLKKGGVSFNTVPMLNLGSLSYRQIWGNIPNIFILKQLAELIHIHLLRSKHMIFGYEYSFLPITLRMIHMNAGFRQIVIDRFRVTLTFDFLPKVVRSPFIYLATHSPLFWPMVKVIAKK